jgi:hypothetical protein
MDEKDYFSLYEEHLGDVMQLKLTTFDILATKIHFAARLYCPTINVA